jgi:hypothetical protein
MIKETIFLILFCLACFVSMAQIGGRYAFESSSLPVNARITALGGSHITVMDSDVGLAFQNPALSNVSMHNQLGINHNSHFAGIGNGNVSYGYGLDSLGLSIHGGLSYVSYGDFDAADATGQLTGSFEAGEVAVILGAGKQLNERIRAGVNIKFLNARFESYGASAVGMDVGFHYQKPGSLSSWALVLQNIGAEFNAVVDQRRALPFNLQLGFSKRLEHLPFRFSIIAHQLQRWYIRYDDPDFDVQVNFLGEATEISAFDKGVDNFFRHFIFNGEFLIGVHEQFRLRLAYNHLRKQEMRLSNFRSLAGFSFGFGFNIRKVKFDYGIGYYHLAGATNHLSLRIDMDKIFNKI